MPHRLTPPNAGSSLPSAVLELAARLGADASHESTCIAFTQSGRMKLSLTAEAWTTFTARQTMSIRSCRFDWRARMGPLGAISVRDALVDGAGMLTVKALGIIPITRAETSAALTRGELMRYLAELAWAPDAILRNTALRWREVDAATLAVGASAGEDAVEVFFNLDSDGRIAGGFALDRPRSAKEPFLPTRWSWRYWDYRRHAQRWLPFAGEVAWHVDGKEIVYWQGRVQTWAM